MFSAKRINIPILDTLINDHRLIYVDNASTTHKPHAVIEAVVNFYTRDNANTGRSIHTLGECATTKYEQARKIVANFINAANASEIVFTRGATEGINLVAAAWAENHVGAGDEIIVSELEHHANVLPWQRLAAQKQAVLRFIPVLLDGTLDMDQYVRMLNSRTKLVAVTHVSNTLGTHVDIKTIIKQAHAVHAKVLVDAAQSVPHQPIDMQDLDVDFLVFSGHKMMAPTGIGVVYINRRLHHELVPYQLGGGMVYEASFDQATYLPMPHLLEAGTPPIAQAIGLAAAIDYIQQHIDFTELQKHEAVLCARLIEGLQKYENKPGSLPALSLVEGSKDKPNHITILGPIDQLKKSGHLVSFVVEGIHAHDIAACLDRHGIATRAGHHCAQPLAKKLGVTASVRVSFYWYNTIEEVERILEVIDALLHG